MEYERGYAIILGLSDERERDCVSPSTPHEVWSLPVTGGRALNAFLFFGVPGLPGEGELTHTWLITGRVGGSSCFESQEYWEGLNAYDESSRPDLNWRLSVHKADTHATELQEVRRIQTNTKVR